MAAEHIIPGADAKCPKCGAPCKAKVNERGGDWGWGTSDRERTTYAYVAPEPSPLVSIGDTLLEAMKRIQQRAKAHAEDSDADRKRDLYHVEGVARAAIETFEDARSAQPETITIQEAWEADQDPRDARIEILETQLHSLRTALRDPMAMLYEKHPQDIMEDER